MKLSWAIITSAVLCVVPQAKGLEVPANMQEYLQSGGLAEDGQLSGSVTQRAVFINYVKTSWVEILNDIETVAPREEQQFLIVAAAEHLPGREYLQFMNKLCNCKTAGKVAPQVFEQAIATVTSKKVGFLAWNYQDQQVRELVQRLQGILLPANNLHPLLANILSGAALGAAETATLGQGLPALQTLVRQ